MRLFRIGQKEFGWAEIVASAKVSGEWTRFVESVGQALACLRYAATANQLPTADSMRKAATAFRYAHNLISAEETEAWLSRWGMKVEDWMDCLRGELLRKQLAANLDQILAQTSIAEADISDVIQNYAVCTDRVTKWSNTLAGKAAVAAHLFDANVPDPSADDLVYRIESEFEQKKKQAINRELIETKICDHRLDWIHLECRCLWLAEEHVAREAAWCITEDGLTLDEVAAEANSRVRPWNFYVDEIETNIRPYFLAARQGDFLGPWKLRNSYPLFSVINKRLPSANDPQIVLRAEQQIANGLLSQAMNERVKWLS